MRRYRINPLDAMENAIRRIEEAATARASKGGVDNQVRALLMLAGADALSRERLERMRREERTR